MGYEWGCVFFVFGVGLEAAWCMGKLVIAKNGTKGQYYLPLSSPLSSKIKIKSLRTAFAPSLRYGIVGFFAMGGIYGLKPPAKNPIY